MILLFSRFFPSWRKLYNIIIFHLKLLIALTNCFTSVTHISFVFCRMKRCNLPWFSHNRLTFLSIYFYNWRWQINACIPWLLRKIWLRPSHNLDGPTIQWTVIWFKCQNHLVWSFQYPCIGRFFIFYFPYSTSKRILVFWAWSSWWNFNGKINRDKKPNKMRKTGTNGLK